MTRFERGMRRLGAVVAVPLLVIAAAWLVASVFWLFHSYGANPFCAPQPCTSPALQSWATANRLAENAIGCAATGACWYAIMRAIGWVGAGFIEPPKPPPADPPAQRQ